MYVIRTGSKVVRNAIWVDWEARSSALEAGTPEHHPQPFFGPVRKYVQTVVLAGLSSSFVTSVGPDRYRISAGVRYPLLFHARELGGFCCDIITRTLSCPVYI